MSKKSDKRKESMALINKQSRILLTYMTGLKEFKFFEKDNEDLVLRDKDLPDWTAAIMVLESLIYLTDEVKDAEKD